MVIAHLFLNSNKVITFTKIIKDIINDIIGPAILWGKDASQYHYMTTYYI